MNGTDDPLVPYAGGEVLAEFAKIFRRAHRGNVISTNEMIDLWIKHDGIASKPEVTNLPDKDQDDGAKAIKSEWSLTNSLSVVLYKIVGGGHTYPGGIQYLPKRLVGNTCKDFDASEAIWEFFTQHGR
jgi:polyhydroxybutyrate depolymerase